MNTWIVTNQTCDSWEKIYSIAKEDKDHPLWENYQQINIEEYQAMIINVRNDIPAAFHGVYNNGRWPDNVARICNRAYINPYFRRLGQGLKITSENIKYALKLYPLWERDVLFISRGVQYNDPKVSWKKFKNFCEYVIRSTGYNLVYDDLLYKCCPNETKDCYQFALWYDPKGIRQTLDIKSITQEQWTNL